MGIKHLFHAMFRNNVNPFSRRRTDGGGGGKGGFLGEGVCSLPPPNFGQQEKIWAKPVFKDISMLFYYFEVGVTIQLHLQETVVAYHVMSFWLLGKGIIC